jgi:hypothetical protein
MKLTRRKLMIGAAATVAAVPLTVARRIEWLSTSIR